MLCARSFFFVFFFNFFFYFDHYSYCFLRLSFANKSIAIMNFNRVPLLVRWHHFEAHYAVQNRLDDLENSFGKQLRSGRMVESKVGVKNYHYSIAVQISTVLLIILIYALHHSSRYLMRACLNAFQLHRFGVVALHIFRSINFS